MILIFTRRGILFLSFLFLNIFNLKSQNLVPNWDFEEFYICPSGPQQLQGIVEDWLNPTLSGPSYFNSCADTDLCSVPDNYYGYNLSHSGNGYTCILGFREDLQERCYISVKLTDSLQYGITYCVGLYLNLSNSVDILKGSRYASDRIGFFLSDTALYFNTFYIIPVVPQVQFINPEFYTDTLNWTLCYTQYTAVGGEQYITVGNFDINENTNYIQVSNSNNSGTLFYIDDVFVYKCSDVYTADAREDMHICKGDSVQIGMQTLPDYKYKWMPTAGLSNDTIGNPYASPQQTTTYYLYLNKYIETVDSVTVFVDNCGLQMPNAFTPDGNGKNDIFKPLTKGFKELHGTIFNRWGQKIYEWNDVNGGWDGRSEQGNDVSNGVYFYIVSVIYDDDTEEMKTGSVEVIR